MWFHVCQGSTYKKKFLTALKLLLITTLTKCLQEGKMYSNEGYVSTFFSITKLTHATKFSGNMEKILKEEIS